MPQYPMAVHGAHMQLLQQQQHQQQMQLDSSSGDASFGGWVDVQEDQTLGTLQDPLRMLRHALCSSGSSSGLALGDVEHMSLRQLQDDYQGTVNQLALHLSFLDNPFKRSQQGDANPFVNIKRCDICHRRQRHWRCIGVAAHPSASCGVLVHVRVICASAVAAKDR